MLTKTAASTILAQAFLPAMLANTAASTILAETSVPAMLIYTHKRHCPCRPCIGSVSCHAYICCRPYRPCPLPYACESNQACWYRSERVPSPLPKFTREFAHYVMQIRQIRCPGHHTFCAECIENWLVYTKHDSCPVCCHNCTQNCPLSLHN
jgi:hypothetical protein